MLAIKIDMRGFEPETKFFIDVIHEKKKGKIMNKRAISVAVIATMLAGCATVGPDGKEQTDTLKTAGAGAGIGAVVGALIGGKKGALIGAALGGGAGYLVALEARKKELADAQQAAAEIQKDTGFMPAVSQQTFKDTQTGQTAAGLKEMSFTLHTAEVEKRNGLTDKASMTLAKLNKLTTDNGGQLVVVMPKNTSKAVANQILAAAPNASLSTTGRSGQVVFKVLPGKIDGTGMTVG